MGPPVPPDVGNQDPPSDNIIIIIVNIITELNIIVIQ